MFLPRRSRERAILENAEKRAIAGELQESLVNLEHEDRTKVAIAAARKAQKEGQRWDNIIAFQPLPPFLLQWIA